jgi:1-acyl-sn-glycerol-3-phosphate acyltransferase
MCRLIGLSIRTLGTPATARPVITVATHSSWLDVLVLGARLPAHFVAKSEVGTWPVVSFIAWLGATVYVRRTRASTAREAAAMRDRLRAGDSLILFPEGTTSDGARVAPFRSAFLSIAETRLPDGTAPLVQPVSLVYDRLAGLPVRHPNRPLFAWVGDESLAPHFWRLAQQSAFRATVLFHPPVDPAATPSRKALTEAVWRTCAEGSDQLRQNRI